MRQLNNRKRKIEAIQLVLFNDLKIIKQAVNLCDDYWHREFRIVK